MNGILLFLFLLELPVLLFFYINMRHEYYEGPRYDLLKKASIRKLSPEKDSLELEGISVKQTESYYLAVLPVRNRYSNEIRDMSVTASNQDGDLIDCRSINYYDASGNEGQPVIPAGAVGTIPCLITMREEEILQTEKLILQGWVVGEEKEALQKVTIDFTSMKKEQGIK